jgi:predicted NBD/HSP70 family sugar kinase
MPSRVKKPTIRRPLRSSEKSILSELRRDGPLSKPDLAKRIALSPQAVNGIVDDLVRDGLTRRGGQRGGMVGHPSTLYTLSPQGAFAIGLALGTQGLDALLVDFTGSVIYRATTAGQRIDAEGMDRLIQGGLNTVRKYVEASSIEFDRVIGIGLAAPSEVLAQPVLRRSLEAAIDDVEQQTDLPVAVTGHGAAAATAELMAGELEPSTSFLYLSIGQAIESGLILAGEIDIQGSNGYRIGQVPIASSHVGRGGSLHEIASLTSLFSKLRAHGFKKADDLFEAMRTHGEVVDSWMKSTIGAVSTVAQWARGFVNLDVMLLASELPNGLHHVLVDGVRRELSTSAMSKLGAPRIEISSLGTGAVGLGAAMVPIYHHVWSGPSRTGRSFELRSPSNN